VLFAEKFRFSRWVGSENWRYFPEKSTNPENFLSLRLFDDCSEFVLQKVCLNQNFLAGFSCSNAVFREKNANFGFCFDCKRNSNPQNRF
jgi:hypothetical protein